MGKREKQRLAAQQAAGGGSAASDAAAAERDFARLTELADLLLTAGGELDVYSHKKEALQRWADAVLPQTDLLAEGGTADGTGRGRAGRHGAGRDGVGQDGCRPAGTGCGC